LSIQLGTLVQPRIKTSTGCFFMYCNEVFNPDKPDTFWEPV